MRATSAVVDAAFFLLLVGAAVATLTLPVEQPPSAGAAEETADVLATSTATVDYTLAPGVRRARASVGSGPAAAEADLHRRADGTLASHLAAAAVRNRTLYGVQVTHTTDEYENAVADAVRTVARGREQLASVRAVWEPYPGAPLRGTARVGPRPPATGDVHAAIVTVTSEVPEARPRAIRAARGGNYTAVGHAVARRVVAGIFPAPETRSALRSSTPSGQLTVHRYDRFGSLMGANVSQEVRADDVRGANAALADALGDRFASDMRSRFASPTAAAEAVRTDAVQITVRTWSP